MKWNETMEKLAETTTITKRELLLGAATCTLAGMVVGMLVAKMATGWSWSLNLGSGNGSNNQNVGNGNQGEATLEDAGEKKGKKPNYRKNRKEKKKETAEA